METLVLYADRIEVRRIPILPMRHGNQLPQTLDISSTRIPILPMRHGNPDGGGVTNHERPDSDPTYEAWKLAQENLFKLPRADSDPTYEAWKRVKAMHPVSAFFRFRSYL